MPQAVHPRPLKAQASVELLLVSAAFLAFLAVWLPVVNGIMAQGKQAVGMSYTELALSDLIGAGEGLRILGNGNSRELLIRMPCEAEVAFSSGAATAIANGAEIVRPTRFSSASAIHLAAGLNRVAVENKEGEIIYSAVSSTGVRAPS